MDLRRALAVVLALTAGGWAVPTSTSAVSAAPAPAPWVAIELRPLPGDLSAHVITANESGWSIGLSRASSGEPGRPVVWSPDGTPTALPVTSELVPPVYTEVNDDGAVGGQDGSFSVVLHGGVRTVVAGGPSYGPITGLSNDTPPKAVLSTGQVIDTGTGQETALPLADPATALRLVFGYDPTTSTALGGEYPAGSSRAVATSYDAAGAHRLTTGWPFATYATAARGAVTAVEYHLTDQCEAGQPCAVPALHYGATVIPLDYADQWAEVSSVTSYGIAVGQRSASHLGPLEGVAFVYGTIVPLGQLASPPAGSSWEGAVHITEGLAIFANARQGQYLRAFVLRRA